MKAPNGTFRERVRSVCAAMMVCILPPVAQGAEIGGQEMLSALQNDLISIDQTAAINKQNIDYKPYIISVLQRDQLQQLGVSNLREALKLVPGVDISVGMMGVTYPVFRGSNPYSMGQSQLYIDGVAVNDAIFNAYYHYLEMPVDIIERVEVVRGPGSLLAHEHAYGGSINVITRAADVLNDAQETRVFAAGGSNRYREGGALVSARTGSWMIGGDAYYQDASRHSFEGPDSLGDSRMAYFDNENYAVGLNARNGNWNIGGRLTSQVSGPNYGQMFTLSQDPTDSLKIRTNNLHATYTTPVAEKTVVKLSAEYLDQDRKLKNKTVPNGRMWMMQSYPFGRYFYVDYAERKLSALAQIDNDSFEGWHLVAGVKKSRTTVEQNDARMTMPNSMMLMGADLLKTSDRDITTLYGEATYQPEEATSIAAGFKYDDISDHGSKFSPRLSAVHLLDSNNILKAMYTRSYTLPSWRDQYFFNAPTNHGVVGAETVDSYELSYIRKREGDKSLRFNLFYLKNKDQNVINPLTIKVADVYDTTIKGAEVEVQYALGESDDLTFNYSYADATIDRTGEPIPNSAKHMAALANLYRFNDKLSTGTILKYVGPKPRDAADPRGDLERYVTWDQSIVYKDYTKGYTLSLSVQNLLGTHYHLPAALAVDPVLGNKITYPNDFVQPGRTFWVKFEKSWQK